MKTVSADLPTALAPVAAPGRRPPPRLDEFERTSGRPRRDGSRPVPTNDLLTVSPAALRARLRDLVRRVADRPGSRSAREALVAFLGRAGPPPIDYTRPPTWFHRVWLSACPRPVRDPRRPCSFSSTMREVDRFAARDRQVWDHEGAAMLFGVQALSTEPYTVAARALAGLSAIAAVVGGVAVTVPGQRTGVLGLVFPPPGHPAWDRAWTPPKSLPDDDLYYAPPRRKPR